MNATAGFDSKFQVYPALSCDLKVNAGLSNDERTPKFLRLRMVNTGNSARTHRIIEKHKFHETIETEAGALGTLENVTTLKSNSRWFERTMDFTDTDGWQKEQKTYPNVPGSLLAFHANDGRSLKQRSSVPAPQKRYDRESIFNTIFAEAVGLERAHFVRKNRKTVFGATSVGCRRGLCAGCVGPQQGSRQTCSVQQNSDIEHARGAVLACLGLIKQQTTSHNPKTCFSEKVCKQTLGLNSSARRCIRKSGGLWRRYRGTVQGSEWTQHTKRGFQDRQNQAAVLCKGIGIWFFHALSRRDGAQKASKGSGIFLKASLTTSESTGPSRKDVTHQCRDLISEANPCGRNNASMALKGGTKARSLEQGTARRSP